MSLTSGFAFKLLTHRHEIYHQYYIKLDILVLHIITLKNYSWELHKEYVTEPAENEARRLFILLND